MPAAVAAILVLATGAKWGLLSAHMPRHATIARAEALMCQSMECHAVATKRMLLGIDANEQFRATPHSQQREQAQGGTGKGERLPTTHDPRRLDYVGVKGLSSVHGAVGDVRDMARSDHEPVILQLQGEPPKSRPSPVGPDTTSTLPTPRSCSAYWTRKGPTRQGQARPNCTHQPAHAPNMPTSQKAAASNKRGEQHMQRHRGSSDDKHGRTSTSSCAGSAALQRGPANIWPACRQCNSLNRSGGARGRGG